jgi:hypothetical protein
MKFEYEKRYRATENESQMLKEMGEHGWELCAVHSDTFYFKRKIEVENVTEPDVLSSLIPSRGRVEVSNMVMKILTENTHIVDGQVRGVIVHGAIEKLTDIIIELTKRNPSLFWNKTSTSNERENDDNRLLVNNQPPIFHVVMDRQKMGLSHDEAMKQDMASEYAIVADLQANGGLIVYAKYHNEWLANPFSTRFLIRVLLENIGICLPPSSKNKST